MSTERSKRLLADYDQRAREGDPDAQMALAWEYVRGELVARDFDVAVALFRKAELRKPELARFNLAKAKYLNGDANFREPLVADCDAGFGPALHLMGVFALRASPSRRDEALRYFQLAAQRGHLVSQFQAWRWEKVGFWRRLVTLLPAIRLFARMLAIRWRDVDDIRVLT